MTTTVLYGTDPNVSKNKTDTQTSDRAYWSGELGRARKRFRTFWDAGDIVIDSYRMQKADGNDYYSKDKYNILYSSTETIRPNLYAATPKPRVVLRSTDTATDTARIAARILEGCLEYVVKEEDFDELMTNVVEDYLLPGLGTAWVRYEARFRNVVGMDGKPLKGEDDEYQQELLDEMVKLEYVYWQDFLCGVSRSWKETPWVARRLYLTEEEAKARFGKAKSDQLQYQAREGQTRDMDSPSETAEAWEIWCCTDKMVYWYAESYPLELLDSKPDPLKLKKFYPCPRPIRAVSNTRTFVPRSLYSQYKSQAETLNILTKRIRLLGEALRVVGLYDGSQAKLNDLLNPASGNRMISVDSWAAFAQSGGIKGSVEWLPLDAIIQTLTQLQSAREVAKAEIYEITGFSDIQRGVTKASETLGAQNIKNDWSSARVKQMQNEVQRFARDLISIAGEVISEHCDPMTIAIFSGIGIPDPAEVAANPSMQQNIQTFKAATALIKSELRRTSTVDIETDSTLLADDASERADRTAFLSAAGAFLQQAVPAATATPELGPLLGAMLMFVVRTFPSSRPIEDEFEKVQTALQQNATQPQNQDKDGKQAKAQADMQIAQMNNQTNMQRIQAENQSKMQELQIRDQHQQQTNQAAAIAEQNRHTEKMLELQLRQKELEIRDKEGAAKAISSMRGDMIARENADTLKFTALHDAAIAEMGVQAQVDDAVRTEELEYAKIDSAEGIAGDKLDAAQAAQEANAASEGAGVGEGGSEAASDAPSPGDEGS